jgi:hypothetical protein
MTLPMVGLVLAGVAAGILGRAVAWVLCSIVVVFVGMAASIGAPEMTGGMLRGLGMTMLALFTFQGTLVGAVVVKAILSRPAVSRRKPLHSDRRQ